MSYYIRNDKGVSGPLEIHELKGHGITKDSLVLSKYLYQWTKAGEVLELIDLFSQLPASRPHHDKTASSLNNRSFDIHYPL